MASAMFSKGKGSIAKGEIVLASDDIRVILLDSTYTFDDTDQYLSDVLSGGASGAEIARSNALNNQSISADGVFDADDEVLTAVASGDTVANAIVYKYDASDASARLISFHEGVDVVTNGQDITVVWSNGASKIFKL